MANGTPVPSSDVNPQSSLSTMMDSLSHDTSFILYSVKSYDASSFTIQLSEVKEEEFYGLDAACSAIPTQHEICLAHPASCQSTQMNIGNFEKTIKIRSHSLISLKRVCELPAYPSSDEIVSRCHQGLKWTPGEAATKEFSFFTSMIEGFTTEYLQQERGTRVERFIVSTPIIVGTAIGAASIATAGVTAAVVANQEVQGIVEAEKVHRTEDVDNTLHNNYVNLNLTGLIAKDLDNIRLTEAWSSQSGNSVSQAESSGEEINHLFSKSEIFEFSNPRSEEFYNTIGEVVSRYSTGLTKSEVMESTRLSADITSMITTAISVSAVSQKCDDMLLIKTMVTPVVNHRSRLEVSMVEGRLVRKYGNHSTYILLSQDAVVSRKTKMFGQDIHVVGRVCTVHNSVNASSTASNDALFEEFSFQFEGNLTVIETCPLNGTTISQNWTFSSQAKLKLPLVCSLRSDKINCDSIKLQSSKTKELHMKHYRMEVIEQHLEEEKIDVNSTVFIRSNIKQEENAPPTSTSFLEKMKWPLIGTLAAIASLIFIGLVFICQLKNPSSSGVSVEINNAATSNNESPICTSEVSNQYNQYYTPSLPSAPQFQEEAPVQDAPPNYYSTVDIKKILAIPPAQRNPFETQEVIKYMAEQEGSSAPQPEPSQA